LIIPTEQMVRIPAARLITSVKAKRLGGSAVGDQEGDPMHVPLAALQPDRSVAAATGVRREGRN